MQPMEDCICDGDDRLLRHPLDLSYRVAGQGFRLITEVMLLLLKRKMVGFLYLLGVRVPWRNGEGRMVLRFAILFFSCLLFSLRT